MSTNTIHFEQIIRRGCGLDVHKDNVVATIRGDGLLEDAGPFPVLLAIYCLLATG